MAKLKNRRIIDSINSEILSSDKILSLADLEIQSLDPDGDDKNIILPDESISGGYSFKIFNSGSVGGLVVKDSSNTNIVTTLIANSMGLFICNGETWKCTSSGSDILVKNTIYSFTLENAIDYTFINLIELQEIAMSVTLEFRPDPNITITWDSLNPSTTISETISSNQTRIINENEFLYVVKLTGSGLATYQIKYK